jgi:uncharacterized protein YabE (DUF348 family)
MKKNLFLKIFRISRFFLTGFSILFFLVFLAQAKTSNLNFNSEQKNITLTDGGLTFEVKSKAQKVQDFLNEQKIVLRNNDMILPATSENIYSGTHVTILRAKKITIKEKGDTTQTYTLQNTVEQAIWDNKNMDLAEDDFTNPSRQTLVKDGMIIAVTHVLVKEETKQEDIAFKTISNEDDSLGWRIKKITQKGIKGIQEVKYKVVYYDEKEISRKVLEKNTVKDPTEEIVTQGTYMKLGKGKTGQGTWYAFKGGLFAASLTIPRSGYAKVTNTDNGKSVVVQINDSGPYGKGRIIDLDKVAFQKIADLGAGVVNVKVEQVLN